MTTIEKIAIDHIVAEVIKENGALIGEVATAKAAFDEAKKAFMQASGPLVAKGREAFKQVEAEVSAEAKAYYEAQIAEKTGSPFKVA